MSKQSNKTHRITGQARPWKEEVAHRTSTRTTFKIMKGHSIIRASQVTVRDRWLAPRTLRLRRMMGSMGMTREMLKARLREIQELSIAESSLNTTKTSIMKMMIRRTRSSITRKTYTDETREAEMAQIPTHRVVTNLEATTLNQVLIMRKETETLINTTRVAPRTGQKRDSLSLLTCPASRYTL
jgi:hypothetical protein